METFNKGLNLDSPNKLQPDGTYRFALNAILETIEGDYGSISNERGTEFCLGLAEGWEVIGDQLLNDDTFVLFVTNNEEGSIIHFDPNRCVSTTLVSSPDFNFSTSYPIDTLFRIRKGCERTIYFTDTVNPYRVINIDNIDSYLDSNGDLDVQSLNFTPDLDIPKIDSARVNNGGGVLPLGSYSFAIRYLDSDGNPTNWFYTTQPVNIYDEPLSSQYETIDGGFNLVVNDQGEGILGGVPVSNKSITLSLSNLDTSYAYYQIGIIPAINNTASPQLVYEMNRVGIGNTTDSTTITSLEEDGIIQGSLADVTVDNVNIQLVQAHEQKDNRLFLAGVSSPTYDWAKFQLAANEITTRYTTKEVPVKTLTETGDPKNPSTPFEHKTFMGDEIYALAIQYFFKDGSLSPAFHIPGREATAADLAILREFQEVSPEDIAHIPDNEFEDNPIGSQRLIRRWKYENTFSVSSKELGYYETNTAYPSVECEVDGQVQRVFPEGNIRHHRIPDRKRLTNTIDIDGVAHLRLIGLEFDNITYPSQDIVGHRFLTARRNLPNTTILDNGIWTPPTYNGKLTLDPGGVFQAPNFVGPSFADTTLEEGVIFDSLLIHSLSFSDLYDNQGSNVNSWTAPFGRVFSPKQLVDNFTLDSYSHLQFLRTISNNSNTTEFLTDSSYDYPGPNTNWRIDLANLESSALSVSTPINFVTVLDRLILQPRQALQSYTPYPNNQSVTNLSHTNIAEVLYVNKEIEAMGVLAGIDTVTLPKLYQISFKQYVKPFPNLEALEYYSLNSSYFTLADDQIVFGKDAYVTNLSIFNTYFVDDLDREDNALPTKVISNDFLNNIYIDSAVNFDLVHDGDLDCNARYNPVTGNYADYVAGKTLFQEDPGVSAWRVNETVCREYYGYNIDYSRIDTSKPAFSLNTNSSICSSCIDSYPNRIYASQQSFQEELSDAYRIIRVNDYTDLDASAGPIVDLFKNKDKLYSITPKALFFIPTSPQRLTTNEDNIYVGSADILSIPPARLTTSQSGYGGSTDKFSVCTTEFGTVFIDDTSRRVFMLAGQLEEISNKGLSNYFDNHLNFTLQDRLKSAGFAPMPLSTVSGIGNSITYDPKFRRIIISHRDFEPVGKIQQWPNPKSIDSVDVYWDGETFLHYDINRSLFVPSNFNDTTRWKNRSFTISYSLEFGSWTSWHSYFPQWAFWDNDTFYTTQSGSIYKHNFGEHQTYYGNTKYPHIFEVVSNERAGQTKVFGNVNYLSTVYNWDEDMEEWYNVDDVTFDHYWAYNSEQSTGLMRIQPKGDDTFFNVALNQPTSTLAVHESDNTWTLNDLRDVFTGHNTTPISSRAWEDIQSDYFIDKVPMSVDTEFRGFNQARLRDTFLNVRMYFNPIEDYRITTDFINTRYKQSFR